ncbi:type III-A CRISPR-associated protein Cas10/Csm1 [Leptolinea tardivitalis]|nr:type III-A CRISPR-associated protein Cas10/Csm1 [Leptolinea tardivitalis]GAP23047.1 CRISPR-associated protein Cas10/Csm1, subtype III-A/MTUBE [Leptolinea tardivitalis]
MEEYILQAALAGLIHDVGKILHRADEKPKAKHAEYTQSFIDLLPARYRMMCRVSEYHHNPDSGDASSLPVTWQVSLGDKLSAGERADERSEKDGNDFPMQMVSIFDRINHPSILNDANGTHYLSLEPLKLSKDHIFPQNAPLPKAQQHHLYESLKAELIKIGQCDQDDPETYIETFLSALKEFAWSVPSGYYYNLPDISLYDHSRMTAALAVCVADWPIEKLRSIHGAVVRKWLADKDPQKNKLQPEDVENLKTPCALLVGGDLSGLQKFLYTLSSSEAAKTLRGRSFYLQLLTEAVMRLVLRRVGIPGTNVVYSGGGHFYILAPVSSESKLVSVRKEIGRILTRAHGSELTLTLAWTKVPAEGFSVKEFPKYWGDMQSALSKAKLTPFSELEEDLYDLIFKIKETGGNRDHVCSICGNENDSVHKDADAKEIQLCSLCQSFIKELGTQLPISSQIILGFGEPVELPTSGFTALNILSALGMEVHFSDGKNEVDFSSQKQIFVEKACVWELNDITSKKVKVTGVPCWRTRHYTVNQIPKEKDQPITFDDLQKKAEGIHRLGVLRMDVDNLGSLFEKGLRDKKDQSLGSLSRLSTLSFSLSLFFEGWVGKICSTYKDRIYAVYAGGDDLFLIAPWNDVPGLALAIVDDFRAFTGNNPNLHISGGMAFIHGKYPIYQAAEDAGEAENLAKSFEGKNAFGFLGKAYSWDQFKELDRIHKSIRNLVTSKDENGLTGPQALIGLLRELGDQAEDARKKKGKPVYGPWIWRGEYTLTRMIERERKSHPELADSLEKLKSDLHKDMYMRIEDYAVAARWAQLEIRKNHQEDKK